MIGLSLLFLAVLLLQIFVPAGNFWIPELEVLGWVLWAVFAVEFGFRVYLSQRRWRYVWTHPLDLIIVLVPFLRPLRLLRLLAIVGSFAQRAERSLAGRALSFSLLTAAVLIVVSAMAVLYTEGDNPGSAIDS
ncbi:MAG: voltage-gated potassium channel, partial [Pseudomonadota bacterium]|nr:voltage-gated potassium channel [Pseudomonadota bacterium]